MAKLFKDIFKKIGIIDYKGLKINLEKFFKTPVRLADWQHLGWGAREYLPQVRGKRVNLTLPDSKKVFGKAVAHRGIVLLDSYRIDTALFLATEEWKWQKDVDINKLHIIKAVRKDLDGLYKILSFLNAANVRIEPDSELAERVMKRNSGRIFRDSDGVPKGDLFFRIDASSVSGRTAARETIYSSGTTTFGVPRIFSGSCNAQVGYTREIVSARLRLSRDEKTAVIEPILEGRKAAAFYLVETKYLQEDLNLKEVPYTRMWHTPKNIKTILDMVY